MFEEAKSKGNAVFSAGDYVAAVKHFTDAVPLSPTQPMFLLNVKFGGPNSGDDMEILEETSTPQSSASKRREDKKMEEKVVEPEQMKITKEATGRKPQAVKEKELGNAAKPQRSFISGTIFTGGFNSVTRGHVIDCSMGNNESLKSGLVCGMKGWDEKAIKEKCECRFNICRDCYLDCVADAQDASICSVTTDGLKRSLYSVESPDYQMGETISGDSRDIDEEVAKEWEHTLLQNIMEENVRLSALLDKKEA